MGAAVRTGEAKIHPGVLTFRGVYVETRLNPTPVKTARRHPRAPRPISDPLRGSRARNGHAIKRRFHISHHFVAPRPRLDVDENSTRQPNEIIAPITAFFHPPAWRTTPRYDHFQTARPAARRLTTWAFWTRQIIAAFSNRLPTLYPAPIAAFSNRLPTPFPALN
jgi:hypothetical protein